MMKLLKFFKSTPTRVKFCSFVSQKYFENDTGIFRSKYSCHFCTNLNTSPGSGMENDLTKTASRIIKECKKYDVMVSAIPPSKISDLLKYLFGLGFTERAAVNLLTRSVWSLRQPKFLIAIFDILKFYNLSPDTMMSILENLPSEFKEERRSLDELPDLIASSLKGLTNIGFFDDNLDSVLAQNPQIIFMSFQECVSIMSRLNGLTAASVKAIELILKYPNILTDDWDETVKKFEYVYYIMGYEVEDISKSSIFMHDYNHIRDRHVYLNRTGFFVKVKRKDDEKFPNVNPSLKTVLDSTDAQFAKMFGNLSKEEYLVYLRMRRLEAKKEENERDSDESDDETS